MDSSSALLNERVDRSTMGQIVIEARRKRRTVAYWDKEWTREVEADAKHQLVQGQPCIRENTVATLPSRSAPAWPAPLAQSQARCCWLSTERYWEGRQPCLSWSACTSAGLRGSNGRRGLLEA